MNEAAAREVLLVRAIEAADSDYALLTREDRDYAGRAAAELARWSAAERREPADAERFLAQRARLLLDKLGQRQRSIQGAATAFAWRPWIDWALPLVALIAGLAFERLADRGHVNVLAFPLLLLLVWNLAVYLLLALGLAARLARARPAPGPRPGPADWLRRAASRAAPRGGAALAAALGRFTEDWLSRSAPLTTARVARALHLAAALFAAGAITGLYIRGLVFDYRAGWESTFLDANAVHALLSTVLGPAARGLGQTFPGVEEIAALRFGAGVPGESAARWIHWYALTVVAVVIVPRLLLAAYCAWRAHRLGHAFPINLTAPYFRRLIGSFDGAAACVRVLPFSYTPDSSAADGLQAIARRLLGDRTQVDLRPSIPFGEEARAAQDLAATTHSPAAPIALDIALCSLAATPEHENHGAFLDTLRPETSAARVLLVDEGPYRRRLGAQAGSEVRLDERRNAWRAFAASHDWPIVLADLAAPDEMKVERDLGPLLSRAP
jgi:hypothetical protein